MSQLSLWFNPIKAVEYPGIYLIAKNMLDSLDPSYDLELYTEFSCRVKTVLYPAHTHDRIQNVEVDLDRAEIGLLKTEIDSVDLSANSIVTARKRD